MVSRFWRIVATAPNPPYGLAALLLQQAVRQGQAMPPIQLYDVLRRSAMDMGELGYDHATGYGLLQAAAPYSCYHKLGI